MTIKQLSDETIRRRDVRVSVPWADLRDLIARAAMKNCDIGGAPGINGIVAKVELKQEQQGSPSYHIGEWSAVVAITIPVE